MPAEKVTEKETAMDLLFYILFAILMLGAIYWIVRGKRT